MNEDTYHFVFEVFEFISVQCEPSLFPVLEGKKTQNSTKLLHRLAQFYMQLFLYILIVKEYNVFPSSSI